MKITNDLFISNQKRDITNNNNLGKDAFLNILMTQLKNQDPMEPLDDKEFISQMATFTSLEQLTNLNKSVTALLSQEDKLLEASNLIGKNAVWLRDDLEQISQVQAVRNEGGTIKVRMDNNETIDIKDILSIAL